MVLLSEELGLPVIPCQANRGKGVVDLKHAIRHPFPHLADRIWRAEKATEAAIESLGSKLREIGVTTPAAHAIHLLADSEYRTEDQPGIDRRVRQVGMEAAAECIRAGTSPEEDISQTRTRRVQQVCQLAAKRLDSGALTLSDKIDQVVLHPVGGWFIFIGIMLFVFWTIFSLAEYPMGWVESGIGELGDAVYNILPDGDLRDLTVSGVIGGVGSVVVSYRRFCCCCFLSG